MRDRPSAPTFWISILLALSAAAPFVDALLCAPFALTESFWIPGDRPVCRAGVIVSLCLLAVAGILYYRTIGIRAQSIRGGLVFFIGAPVLVTGIYLFAFTASADQALLTGDQDVTNVSTAIQRTGFTDWLPSPYVAAGSSRSFLAHHFSPSLLLFVPVYRFLSLFDLDHGIYNTVLAATILAGLLLWVYYAYRFWDRETLLLPLILIPFMHSFLLLRQVVSFHFEVLSLPLMALLLLSLRLQGRSDLPPAARTLSRGWPLIALLYLGIKEDMGVYLGFYGGVFFLFEVLDDVIGTVRTSDETKLRQSSIFAILFKRMAHSVYFRLAVISVLWLVVAMGLRLWIAGEGAPGWESYWNAAKYPPFRKTPYAYLLILFSSGFWILFSARSMVVVLGILLLHIVSGMPWHALLESHYSYTILPFLLAGAVRGFSNLRQLHRGGRISAGRFVLLVFLGAACADYALIRDRNHPYPLLRPHPAYAVIKNELKGIPEGACIQSSFHLSPLVPLRDIPLPFTYYRGSPWENLLPGACRLEAYHRENLRGDCGELYRLLLEPPSGCLKEEMDGMGEYLTPVEKGPVLWRLKRATERPVRD